MVKPEIPDAIHGWRSVVEIEMWAADLLDLLGPAMINTGIGCE